MGIFGSCKNSCRRGIAGSEGSSLGPNINMIGNSRGTGKHAAAESRAASTTDRLSLLSISNIGL